jgi:hypothetical protein
MTTPREPDERDPLADYVDGDPDAVRAAAPREPSEAEWDAARRKILERLAQPQRGTSWGGRAALLAGVAALVAASVAVAWFVLDRPKPPNPAAPEVAQVPPVPVLPVAQAHDPLAEFAVLPMASADEVVLHRVPGDGWLPVGIHPLPDLLSLANAEDVELDDPDAMWTNVTPAPGYAPMIFAAKPR